MPTKVSWRRITWLFDMYYVLMDLSMPVCDGLESSREIRKYERRNNIQPPSVTIAITAFTSRQTQEEAASAGVDHFLTKPVRFKDLLKLLAN
jgi:CheY-like chemotaxis protein